MIGPISLEILDTLKPDVAMEVSRALRDFRGLTYADLRLEVCEAVVAMRRIDIQCPYAAR